MCLYCAAVETKERFAVEISERFGGGASAEAEPKRNGVEREAQTRGERSLRENEPPPER